MPGLDTLSGLGTEPGLLAWSPPTASRKFRRTCIKAWKSEATVRKSQLQHASLEAGSTCRRLSRRCRPFTRFCHYLQLTAAIRGYAWRHRKLQGDLELVICVRNLASRRPGTTRERMLPSRQRNPDLNVHISLDQEPASLQDLAQRLTLSPTG